MSIGEDGNFHLRNKLNNKPIRVRLNNAHNFSNYSSIYYKFLCDLQNEDKWNNISLDFKNSLEKIFNYIPRIYFEEAIIYRETWILREKEISEFIQSEDQISNFHFIRIKLKLPRLIVLKEYDNELLYDLSNLLSIRNFLKEIRNKKEVILVEYLNGQTINNESNLNSRNSYSTELIFSVINSVNFKEQITKNVFDLKLRHPQYFLKFILQDQYYIGF